MLPNSDAAFWRFSLDPNRDPKAERSGKHRRGADGIIRPSRTIFVGYMVWLMDRCRWCRRRSASSPPWRGCRCCAVKPALVVPQRAGQRLHIHAVLQRQAWRRCALRSWNRMCSAPMAFRIFSWVCRKESGSNMVPVLGDTKQVGTVRGASVCSSTSSSTARCGIGQSADGVSASWAG